MKLTIRKSKQPQFKTAEELEGKAVRFNDGTSWYLILGNHNGTLEDKQMMPCMCLETAMLCVCAKGSVPVEVRELEEVIIGE